MKVGFISLGCAKNQVNCEQMIWQTYEAGYEVALGAAGCDVAVVNTCGFLQEAREEALAEIQKLVEQKQAGQLQKILVTGCMAQWWRDQLAQRCPQADGFVGVSGYENLPQVIDQALRGEHPALFGDIDAPIPETDRVVCTSDYWAWLRIAEGCDNRCAYCIIPKLRGRYRSREMASLLEEARALSDAGVKELIVIAQDITKYGMDLPEHKRLLPELLRELCKMDFTWIRLHYLYPDQITDELIDVIAEEPKIVKYLDIPLQHVSKRILRAMHRPGDGAEFTALIEDMRRRIPGLVLRTSLIVGLPGETDDEFAELCEFLQNAAIERVGVFEYSPEEGTEAAEMPDQIDAETKQNRRLIVEELQSGVLDDYNTSRHGEVMQVLVEGFDDEQQLWYGRTYADSVEVDGHVYFDAMDTEPGEGEFVSVLITESLGPDLLGVRQKEA